MASRVEMFKEYRESISAQSDKVPVLKTVTSDPKLELEAGLYKKIVIKKRVFTYSILILIVIIVALLTTFGFIVFKGK